jgi:very-short-patch-repair endonuclease
MNYSAQRQPPLDARLAQTASRQHGVVARAQLLALGMDRNAIAYRRRVGRLHALHRGVYAVGHPRLSPEGRFMAAVLAAGPGAVLSHRSAGVLWGLLANRDDAVDVTVVRQLHQRRGVRVHRVRSLAPADRTREAGIPVTTVARTLLDLADVADERTLRRAARQAYVDRRVDEATLTRQLARAPGRRGAPHLKALLGPGAAPTRSELEDRLLALLREHGLPQPAVNVAPPGLQRHVEVDFLFEEPRVVVEADGARYHDDPLARHHDAERQAMLEAAGYRVLRVTWDQVTRRADETVNRLGAALSRS